MLFEHCHICLKWTCYARHLSVHQQNKAPVLGWVYRTGCTTFLSLLASKCLFYGWIQSETCFHCNVLPGNEAKETCSPHLPLLWAHTHVFVFLSLGRFQKPRGRSKAWLRTLVVAEMLLTIFLCPFVFLRIGSSPLIINRLSSFLRRMLNTNYMALSEGWIKRELPGTPGTVFKMCLFVFIW